MPYRHWFVILTTKSEERRIGPYATRRAAEREARVRFGPSSDAGSVVVFYDHVPPRLGHYP